MRLFILLVLVSSVAAAPSATQPAHPGPEGQRAFDALAAYYNKGADAPQIKELLKQLRSDNPAQRRSTGQFLLALLKQSLADERNGRAEWRALPFWGGGSESDARKFRITTAQMLAEGSLGEDALDAVLWLIDDDPLVENQRSGIRALRGMPSARIVESYRKLLSTPHPNAEVVVGAIQDAGARKLTEVAREVRALCTHYRLPIAEAARKQAGALAFEPPPAPKPEEQFTPWLEGELRDIAAMVATPIPEKARWVRVSVTYERQQGVEAVESFSAWLLEETPDGYRTLNLFAVEGTYPKAKVTIAPRKFEVDVEEMLKHRAGGDPADDMLSRRGRLTGQFEPGFVSLPESLLAAWCFARGEKAHSARLIFPRYSAAADARWVKMVTRDLIGGHYHLEMLDAFSRYRDYPRTIEIARHLSKPLFEGYSYRQRAVELAAQLEKRGEDFKTFVLPTPEQWNELKARMSRPQQIEYLAARLRLLNCFQWGQPGGVNLADPQYARPSSQREFDDKAPTLINPYEELLKMKLEVADLTALVPFLADENYLPTFSYWRDFHPARDLFSVDEVVASLVNSAAKRDLAELRIYARLDARDRQEHLARIMAWIKANAGRSAADLLLEQCREAKQFREFHRAATELAQAGNKQVVPLLIQRMNEFPDAADDIVELCYRLSSADLAPEARKWVKDERVDVRYWASLILLKHGNRGQLEGLAVLRPLLDKAEGDGRFVEAFDVLLDTNNEEAITLACSVLKKSSSVSFNTGPMVHRLLLRGRQEAVAYLMQKLDDSTESGSSSGTFNGKQVLRRVTVGDSAGTMLERLRADKYDYPSLAEDEDRARERQKLKAWLDEQIKLIRAGKPHAFRPKPDELVSPQWRVDAP